MSDFPVVLTNAVDGVPGIGTPILAKNLNALEAKVGVDGSAVATSLDYFLKNPASIEPGHKHSKLWASDGSPQAVTVDAAGQIGIGTPTPAMLFHVKASARNTPAALIEDGLGALNNLTIGGYGALLTLNTIDQFNDYHLAYINESMGQVANYISNGSTLWFDHYGINDDDFPIANNALLSYGGFWFNSITSDYFSLYCLSDHKIALGLSTDLVTPSNNPTPSITIDTNSDRVGIGTASPVISDGVGLHIAGKILRLDTTKTPTTAGAAGNPGEICWDSGFIYVCVALNTWKKAAISSW